MLEKLTLEALRNAVSGTAAAFRCVTEYQPAGGLGDKVFPPTYEGGKYAIETRMIEGQPVQCVLLDSVQSQANRMELALLEVWRTIGKNGKRLIDLPVITVKFDDARLKKPFVVTSLEAPHRVADAILRDSLLDGVAFRKSEKGKLLDTAGLKNATGLFGLCPTALIFGIWDSTGPRGGLGAKFQRALVSEMVGIQGIEGKMTGSRIDPAEIRVDGGPLYERAVINDKAPEWTLDPKSAKLEKGQPVLYNRNKNDNGKPGNPSKANHSNFPPTIKDGSFTISRACQTTVLSLTALRRLRFPLNGATDSNQEVDIAARTALAALGLLAAALTRDESADLRSRCHLVAQQKPVWELIDVPGETPRQFELTGNEAVSLFNDAIDTARKLKVKGSDNKELTLPWEGEVVLKPSDDLVQLVAKSQELAIHQATEGGN